MQFRFSKIYFENTIELGMIQYMNALRKWKIYFIICCTIICPPIILWLDSELRNEIEHVYLAVLIGYRFGSNQSLYSHIIESVWVFHWFCEANISLITEMQLFILRIFSRSLSKMAYSKLYSSLPPSVFVKRNSFMPSERKMLDTTTVIDKEIVKCNLIISVILDSTFKLEMNTKFDCQNLFIFEKSCWIASSRELIKFIQKTCPD